MKRVVIVGAGPAGLFAANKLIDKFEVVVVEQNSYIGGSGLHSDGKLNFHPEIGGNLLEFLDAEDAWKIVKEIENTFLRLGMPECHYDEEKMKELERKAAKCGIKFIPIRQAHIGSDYLPRMMEKFYSELEAKGVKFLLNTKMEDIVIRNGRVERVLTDKGVIDTDFCLLALGRSGFEWFQNFVEKNNLQFVHNPIDIGVRVEVTNEVFSEMIDEYKVWDPKFHIVTSSYDDFVRTFCTNPSGFVVKEGYGNSLFGVNGHAMREVKSNNTNFALLVTVKLTEPLENTTVFGKRIVQLANTLGGGKPLIQRVGDLKNNRRSTWDRIRKSYVVPTLKDVTPGDIAMAYPHRIVTDLLEGLEKLDRFIPGVYSDSTLLYAPEVKFYAIRIKTNEKLQSVDIPNLFVAGDGAGVSRGIVGAAATGIIAAEGIKEVM